MTIVRTVDPTTLIVPRDGSRTVLTPGPTARSIENRSNVVQLGTPGSRGPQGPVGVGEQGPAGTDGLDGQAGIPSILDGGNF